MNFNSIEYALFLPIVFLVYWYCLRNRLRLQNTFLLTASYIFYGWWDWRLLSLIIFTTASTYITAIATEKSTDKRRARIYTGINIAINIAILCAFKYFNFFGENFALLFRAFGYEMDWITLDILLPVGISFYTFQAIGYSIDVYRRSIPATRDAIGFATFITFFPQLVAGPIERASNLLPQILSPRRWNYDDAVIGMRQILWGLVKKLAVADLCGQFADTIYSAPDYYGGSTLLLAGILFAFQIYGDFSGYSDIAIGSARLLGIRLSTNFRYPYFAPSVAEFWHRWHISLMTWLRDYVYIPLGGSHRGKLRTMLNIIIVFTLSGLWHGASWTFVAWGFYWAIIMIIERYTLDRRINPGVVTTFILAVFGWILFRSQSLQQFADIMAKIFSPGIFEIPTGLTPFILIIPLVTIEWFGRQQSFPIRQLKMPTPVRWLFYLLLLGVILWSVDGSTGDFIYFQF